MSTLSFRLRFQPGIVFFQEPNVRQAAGLSVAYLLESDVEGPSRLRQGNAKGLSCGAQILPRRPFDFGTVNSFAQIQLVAYIYLYNDS